MIYRPSALAMAIAVGMCQLTWVAHGQTQKEQAELLAAPAAELITTEFLAPAVRQAVANGVATLVARMTAEGNDVGLAFPPNQTIKVVEIVEVPAKRVQVEHPEYELVEVEVIEPVLQSGQPTGRFAKVKKKVNGKQIGTRMIEQLRPDKDGSEKMMVPIYGPGGPAAWAVNLPGLNGMALYVLAKAGLGKHPATVKHAAALAEHASQEMGLPDYTFDIAWMAAGFAALGPDSTHEPLARRLLGKLIDGQIRQPGDLDGLWGPVCVNYGYFGKLMTLGQMVRQELDVQLPKKLETASPAEQEKLVAMGRQMKDLVKVCDQTHRDVFRSGTRMLGILSGYTFEERAHLPGLPYNAYQWVVSDVESTAAAAFTIAAAKQAGLLPRETVRVAIKGKKVHAPVKTEAAIRAAAKRMAAAIDDDGGATALAFVAENKGFEKTGFPAPSFATADATPAPFGFQTACTAVAAQEAIESLAAADDAVEKQLAAPRDRAHDRAEKIAARWYAESANPIADAWNGMYASVKVSHADLKKTAAIEVPAPSDTAVDALPWGPSGCLYRIVPGFRGLFTGIEAEKRFDNDLFRQIAYRLIALQDPNGQWPSGGAGNQYLSTASESLAIRRTADNWHAALNRDPAGNIGVPDPVSGEMFLQHGHMPGHQASWPDAAAFPTLASLLFLVESIDRPVSLDGIAILPEPSTEPAKQGDAAQPPPRLTPGDAVRKVARPNSARQELCYAIIASRWPRKTVAAPAAPAPPSAEKPEEKPAAEKEKEKKKEAAAEDDGLGKFEDLLEPSSSDR